LKRIVLFAVCAIAATAAAAQWHYLSGGKLSGISSVGSYVWAVGQDGLFFFSVDNGETWRRVPRFTARNLVDVEFWDQSFGLVTAEGDFLYRTTDDGASWDSSYVQYIGGHIRFITRDCIWITSNGGARILRSTDGGLSWPVSRASQHSSWFLDSLNGWANDGYNHVDRTTDAGQSWSFVGSVPEPYQPFGIYCFGFSDSLNGICAWLSVPYDPHMHFNVIGWSATTDGGVSWQSLSGAATPGVGCDVAADGRVYGLEQSACIVFRPSGYLRRDESTFEGFRDVSPARGDLIWLCGDGAAIWSSSDSGTSWSRMKPRSGATLLDVDFLDTLHGWGISSNWAARTTDGGRSWIRAAVSFGIAPMSSVVALDEVTCVVAAGWWDFDVLWGWEAEFGLGRTNDAGATWDTLRDYWEYDGPMASSRLARVGRHLWHPGVWAPNGNSLRSSNGGTTWSDMDTIGTAGDGEPPDISFVDTLNGWAIDSRQNIRNTTDGGDSWTIIATGLNVKRLKMTSLTTGWAISDSELFKTTDGGVTWDGGVVHSGLQAIAFCDSIHGALVGLKGLILRTSDAGQTWVWDESDFTSDLYGVFMLDSTHMWAVGQYGLVLGFGDWAIGIDEAGGQVVTPTRLASVRVRPSPCRARATVEFSRPLTRSMQVTLVDIAGRVMQSVPARVGARSLELDVRSMPNGVYFLRAGTGPAARLVVQR